MYVSFQHLHLPAVRTFLAHHAKLLVLMALMMKINGFIQEEKVPVPLSICITLIWTLINRLIKLYIHFRYNLQNYI